MRLSKQRYVLEWQGGMWGCDSVLTIGWMINKSHVSWGVWYQSELKICVLLKLCVFSSFKKRWNRVTKTFCIICFGWLCYRYGVVSMGYADKEWFGIWCYCAENNRVFVTTMQQILHKTWPPKDITAGQHLYMTDLHSIYGQYLRQKPKTHVVSPLTHLL